LAKLRHKGGLQRYEKIPKSKEICAKRGVFTQISPEMADKCADGAFLHRFRQKEKKYV
jgi:hypothetical protein